MTTMSPPTRVTTGIPGLDTMLQGGFLPQTVNLVEGAPGCGKSTLGMQFIYNGAIHNEPGVILTFEEFPEQYYRDADTFGWNFRALERNNKLRVVMSSPQVTQLDLEQVGGVLERVVTEIRATRILIDSVTHFEQLSDDPVALRQLLCGLFNALKRQRLTTIVTRETEHLLGQGLGNRADSGIHYMADSYTMLRYVEIESAIQRAIIVLKMRGSNHDSLIRQFDINEHGITVQAPFEGQEGIMSGTPTRMARAFIKAFIKK